MFSISPSSVLGSDPGLPGMALQLGSSFPMTRVLIALGFRFFIFFNLSIFRKILAGAFDRGGQTGPPRSNAKIRCSSADP